MRNLGSVAGFDVVLNVDAQVVLLTSVGRTRRSPWTVEGGRLRRIGDDEQAFNMSIDLILDFDFVDGQAAVGTGRYGRPGSRYIRQSFRSAPYAKDGAMPTAAIENVTIELQDIEIDPIEDIELSIIALGIAVHSIFRIGRPR